MFSPIFWEGNFFFFEFKIRSYVLTYERCKQNDSKLTSNAKIVTKSNSDKHKLLEERNGEFLRTAIYVISCWQVRLIAWILVIFFSQCSDSRFYPSNVTSFFFFFLIFFWTGKKRICLTSWDHNPTLFSVTFQFYWWSYSSLDMNVRVTSLP